MFPGRRKWNCLQINFLKATPEVRENVQPGELKKNGKEQQRPHGTVLGEKRDPKDEAVTRLEMRCHCYLGDEKEQLKAEAEKSVEEG